jgi:rod shape-determining protein MreC
MRNLLVFLTRNYFFLLFVALEFFAVSLLVRYNYFHRAGAVSTANAVTGSMLEARDNMTEYFSLKTENQRLARENALLRSQQKGAFMDYTTHVDSVNDTIFKQQYQYVEAKVVDNSVNRRNNYITLNRGSAQGIQPDMGVISPDGIVGIVKDVSANFCTVMSLLHKDMHVSAKLKKDGTYGQLDWSPPDYTTAILHDLPSHAKMKKGDTLVSSGLGDAFPEGIPVGIVQAFKIKSGDNFFTVDAKLTTDFKKLKYVYVVRNLMKYEQQELLKKTLESDKEK